MQQTRAHCSYPLSNIRKPLALQEPMYIGHLFRHIHETMRIKNAHKIDSQNRVKLKKLENALLSERDKHHTHRH